MAMRNPGWRSDSIRIPYVHPEAPAVPPVEEAHPGNATGLCWSEALLAAWCAAPQPVVAPVGVFDVQPNSPEPLCGAGREKTEETRARGEHSDGRVLSVGLHHDNAMKNRRHACSAILFHWRSRQRGFGRRRALNSGPKTVSTPEWGESPNPGGGLHKPRFMAASQDASVSVTSFYNRPQHLRDFCLSFQEKPRG